jgi:hypothetical protein
MAGNKDKSGKAGDSFTYTGQHASLFDHKGKEYNLHPGETYELPADCPHVQSLIGQKLLTQTTAKG